MNRIKGIIENRIKGNDILKAVFALFGTNLFASVVGVIGSFVQGRFVTAEELGFFKQFSIITGYAFFLHLGVFHAIERLYPLYMGKGEKDNAKKTVEIGNAWMLIVCIPLTILFAILSLTAFIKGDWRAGLCWIVQIVANWTSLYGGFLSATYRSGKEFQRMAKANVYNPLLSFLAIPLYWVQPFIAMVIRNCTSAVSTIRLYLSRPVKVKWRWSLKEWLALVKEGFPLYTASYITTTGLDSFRGTLILLFLTQTDLGYWSFAYMCITLVLQLPQSITAVYIPRIIAEYSRRNRIKDAIKITKKPLLYGALFMIPIVPLGILACIYLLPLILPNYVGTIPLLCVLMLSVPLKLSDVLNTLLVAMNRKVAINFIAILGTVIQIAVSLIGSYVGLGILAFGWGFFAGYMSRIIFLVTYIFIKSRKECNLT